MKDKTRARGPWCEEIGVLCCVSLLYMSYLPILPFALNTGLHSGHMQKSTSLPVFQSLEVLISSNVLLLN